MDAGSEETSEYTHYYVAEMAGDPAAPTGEIDWSATPSHLGGSDIYNGVITNWGPDWTNEGSKVDAAMEAASDDYTAVESTDGLPSSFSTAAYSSSETYDWGGSEVTYYADDGSVLGYANVSTWDDGDGGKAPILVIVMLTITGLVVRGVILTVQVRTQLRLLQMVLEML